jgi:subtilisin family serine protease
MNRKYLPSCAALAALLAACGQEAPQTTAATTLEARTFDARADRNIGVNVLLTGDITSAILSDLAKYGRVRDQLPAIDAVTLQTTESKLPALRALPYVAAANPDAERKGAPTDTVAATDFVNGINTWDLDAVNVTDYAAGRTVGFTGSGVYVAVLDTGLVALWRNYFPEERIATQFGIAFGGGGNEVGNVSTQPDKWQHDTNSHGTHVTSTILGYSLRGAAVNGVAPLATIIPVKVLNQNGSGWSSMIARGISYVTELKKSGALGDSPVVINMSLGGPELDAVEKAAIDAAIEAGVIVVASAGNEGEDGMGYPGAYAPVISVAASGWIGEWVDGAGQFATSWWNARDVRDRPVNATDFYITDFSSRELAGQDLDVAAPGSWVVGPFNPNKGQLSYFFLGGTSMASPHVAGIVALMAEKFPALGAAQAESILEETAIPLPAGCRTVFDPDLGPTEFCWKADATGAGLATADAALAATP